MSQAIFSLSRLLFSPLNVTAIAAVACPVVCIKRNAIVARGLRYSIGKSKSPPYYMIWHDMAEKQMLTLYCRLSNVCQVLLISPHHHHRRLIFTKSRHALMFIRATG